MYVFLWPVSHILNLALSNQYYRHKFSIFIFFLLLLLSVLFRNRNILFINYIFILNMHAYGLCCKLWNQTNKQTNKNRMRERTSDCKVEWIWKFTSQSGDYSCHSHVALTLFAVASAEQPKTTTKNSRHKYTHTHTLSLFLTQFFIFVSISHRIRLILSNACRPHVGSLRLISAFRWWLLVVYLLIFFFTILHFSFLFVSSADISFPKFHLNKKKNHCLFLGIVRTFPFFITLK